MVAAQAKTISIPASGICLMQLMLADQRAGGGWRLACRNVVDVDKVHYDLCEVLGTRIRVVAAGRGSVAFHADIWLYSRSSSGFGRRTPKQKTDHG